LPWNCEFCDESFEDQEELHRHLREKHRDRVKLAKFEHPMGPKAEKKPK